MASIDFPYAHDEIVQKAVSNVDNLKNESLAADKAVAVVKGDASDLVTKYKNDITALAGLPIAIEQFSEVGSHFLSMHFLPRLTDWKLDSPSINFCGQHVLMVQHWELLISMVMDLSVFQSSSTHIHLNPRIRRRNSYWVGRRYQIAKRSRRGHRRTEGLRERLSLSPSFPFSVC